MDEKASGVLYIVGIQETIVGVGLDRRHVQTDYFPAYAHLTVGLCYD